MRLTRIRSPVWQPISLLARGLFLADRSTTVGSPQPVRRVVDTAPTSIQYMCIDHCRRHVFMSKQFLDCPNIAPVPKKVSREGIGEGLCDTRIRHSAGSRVCEPCGGASGRRGNVDLRAWSNERWVPFGFLCGRNPFSR